MTQAAPLSRCLARPCVSAPAGFQQQLDRASREFLQLVETQYASVSDGDFARPQSGTRCLELAKIGKRFTVHGLRYTFADLVHRANVDVVVRRALTGHVTEEMQRKYSTVGLDEKRAAVAEVIRLVPPERDANAGAAVIEPGTAVGPALEAGTAVGPALEAGTAVGPALEAGTAVGLEVGPNAEAGRAVGPEVGPNVVPLRLVPPVSAVATAEVGPEVGPERRSTAESRNGRQRRCSNRPTSALIS